MRNILTICLLVSVNFVMAQKEETPVNMLNAPSSTVFNLMGIESSEIVRPKDPTDLYVSIRNSSEGFSTLPKNYAVEFAPYWLFNGRNARLNSFESDSFKHSVLQTMVVSVATRIDEKIDVSNYSQVGAGIKFSLVRGKMSAKFKEQLTELDLQLKNHNSWLVSYMKKLEESNPEYQALIAKKDQAVADNDLEALKKTSAEITDWQTAHSKQINKDASYHTNRIRKQIKKLDMKRVGWISEFNAAAVWEFPENNTSYSRMRKMGVWVTAGYTPKTASGFDALAMLRYIYSKDQANFFTELDTTLFSEYSNFLDVGAKLNYSTPNGKLSAGFEAVARIVSTKTPAFWKYDFNINYQLMPNKLLSFTIGQDYSMDDPSIGGDRSLSPNDLILALNLVLGFGNDRPIN